MLPQGWADLVALLDGQPDADPMSRLQRLCTLCARVSGVTGVALTFSSEETASTVCATDDLAERIGEVQDTIGEGPRHDVLRDGAPVLVADVAEASQRWPGFAPAAAEAGIRAIFVMPLRTGAIHLGVLELYRVSAGALTEAQLKDVQILAEAASVLLTVRSKNADDAFVWILGDRSRFRPEVHQAVGATMVHLTVGPGEALARLYAHAYTTDTSVAVVAREILAKRLRLEPD